MSRTIAAAVVAAAALCGAPSAHAQQNGKIFYIGIGGATQEALRKAPGGTA
jgi:hypothetical protein